MIMHGILLAIFGILILSQSTTSLSITAHEKENVLLERNSVAQYSQLQVIIDGNIKIIKVQNNFDGETMYLQQCGPSFCNIWSQYCDPITKNTCTSCANLCHKVRTGSPHVQKSCESRCAGYLLQQQHSEKPSPETTTGVTGSPNVLAIKDHPEKCDNKTVHVIIGILSVALVIAVFLAIFFGTLWYSAKYSKIDLKKPTCVCGDGEETSPMQRIPAVTTRTVPDDYMSAEVNQDLNHTDRPDRTVPIGPPESDDSTQAANGSVPNGIIRSPVDSPLAAPEMPRIANQDAQDHVVVYHNNRNHDQLPGITSEESVRLNLPNHNGGIPNGALNRSMHHVLTQDQFITQSSGQARTIGITEGGESTDPLLSRYQQSDRY